VDKTIKNEKGFSLIETILALCAVLIIGMAGYLVHKNNHKPSTTSGSILNTSTHLDWVSYSSKDGNYKAMFPNSPQSLAPTNETASDGTTYTINGVYTSEDTTAFGVVYTANIKGSSLDNSIESEMQAVQNGRIVATKNISVSGYPAKSYQVVGTTKEGNKATVTGEVVATSSLIYNATAFQINEISPNTQYFLNSFKVGH